VISIIQKNRSVLTDAPTIEGASSLMHYNLINKTAATSVAEALRSVGGRQGAVTKNVNEALGLDLVITRALMSLLRPYGPRASLPSTAPATAAATIVPLSLPPTTTAARRAVRSAIVVICA
jgi:hypothetical protein